MISEIAKKRCKILAFWERYGDEATKEAFKVSRPTLYRWQRELRQSGGKLESLNKQSTTPKQKRKRVIPEEVKDFILNERKFDPLTNTYGVDQIGDTYIVERQNPVPYELTWQVDIWTTMQDHKFQLMEQIQTLFHPALDLQTSENPLDWTSLTTVELDSITWSSDNPPMGTDDKLDIGTLTFKVRIELSVPMKVKRQRPIRFHPFLWWIPKPSPRKSTIEKETPNVEVTMAKKAKNLPMATK